MKSSVPYLVGIKKGRPRWEPGPKLRREGWKGRDLKRESGEWMSEGEAIDAARALNADTAAARGAAGTGGVAGRRPSTYVKPARTVQALYELWTGAGDDSKGSPRWQKLARNTKLDYKSKLRPFLAEFGDRQVAALEPEHLYTFWEEMVAERGHAMANAIIRAARTMLTYARLKGWRRDNPASKLALTGLPPRVVVWTPLEVELFVRIADRMGAHSVADAVIIALHTGQRQGDVLALELPQIARGRSIFRQSKTKARVAVPFTPALETRIADIRRRRAKLEGVVDLSLARRVVLDERGREYAKESFGKAFRPVRARVDRAMKIAAFLQIKNDEPDFGSKWFSDLRDTAITRLALAGCTIPEIRAISGHELETIVKVLKHYLALDDRMADAAIARLKAYMEEENIAI